MITVKFYLKRAKIKEVLRKDEVAIIAKITEDKEHRFEISTGERIKPVFWDSTKQEVKSTFRGHFEINEALLHLKSKILRTYRENEKLSFSQFKALIQEKRNQKKTLFLALDQFLNVYRHEKDSKTLAKYVTLARQLEAFDKIHPIDLSTIDYNFYDRFKAFLYQIQNPFYKDYRLIQNGDVWDLVKGDKGQYVGIFDDQVYAYMRQVKTFLAWSEKRGYKVSSTYKNWEIIKHVHEPITLTLEELEKLENHTFKSRALDVARDFLVLQCRTGQRISDIKRFNLKDLIDFKWKFAPKKGNRLSPKTVTVYFKGFSAPALNILQKYNWQLPKISDQKINDNIKRACKEAGIDTIIDYIRWAQNKKIRYTAPKYELLSNHSGRRTFVTLLLQNDVSISDVMQLTGITEYKTIRHYKGKFEDSAIEQALEKIPTSKSILKKAL